MRRVSKLIAASGLLVAFTLPSAAYASPIGTPAANRVPTGKGKNLGGLFDDMVGRRGGDHADAGEGKTGSRHRHMTSREWHDAYIARHGHDLPSPLERPGGH